MMLIIIVGNVSEWLPLRNKQRQEHATFSAFHEGARTQHD
jgi:hypothetical protein